MNTFYIIFIIILILINCFAYLYIIVFRLKNLEKNLYLENITNEYIKNRFKLNLLWYEKHALINCFNYNFYILLSIILAAFIPFLKDLNKNNANNNIYIIISILITIINGYLYIKDPKTKWYTYRKYSEILKRLISDRIINNLNDNEFLKNLEDILSEESGTWYSKGNINSTFLSGKGFNSDNEKS